MEGRIRKIWENETSKGQPYWTLNIDDQRYNVWNPKYMNGLSEGDYVTCEFKEQGKYRNISKIERIEVSDPPSGPDSSGRGYEPPGRDYQISDKNVQIIRMSVLRSAAKLLYNLETPWEEKGRYTIDLARRFERYVTGLEDALPEPGTSPSASEGSLEQSDSEKPTTPPPSQRRPSQQPAQSRPSRGRPTQGNTRSAQPASNQQRRTQPLGKPEQR